ncbi:hypothetical protein RJ640_015490 [Escallonia rubra]|uniref:Cytochrome b5 heme-binding domain-containing protein n=1 Tax=Escallonia rubra TaxID=112253 RepID=A0AA88URL7_9ASTE|nr:hypothetical protein RJ640_015490 [Escallonia rubra]
MDNDEDFTFCQVGVPIYQDGIETHNVVPDVSRINIEDDSTKGSGGDHRRGIVWNDKVPSHGTSENQKTVGSLTFDVIDVAPTKQPSDLSKHAISEDAGNSVKASEGNRTSARKPVPRAKVPFEKGYSQMDWFKVTRTHPDLAGLNGKSNKRLISLSEVKQHQTEGSMWTVLKGRVYNIAPYMKFHPGGVDMLMKAVGKDSTSLFNKYHAWVNFEFLLEKCLVGILDDSQ